MSLKEKPFTVRFPFPSKAVSPTDNSWDALVMGRAGVTVTDAFIVPFTDVLVALVAEAFAALVVDTVVGATVVRTGVGVVFTGDGVGVLAGSVFWVVGAVGELCVWSAGVAFADWFVPGIRTARDEARMINRMTAPAASRPHFRRGIRRIAISGPPLPSSGRSTPGVPSPVTAGGGGVVSRGTPYWTVPRI